MDIRSVGTVVFRAPTIIDSIMGNMGAPVDDGLFQDDVIEDDNDYDIAEAPGQTSTEDGDYMPSTSYTGEQISEVRGIPAERSTLLLST